MNVKSQLRQLYKTERAKMSADDVNNKSEQMCNVFLSDDIYKDAKCIMLYMPLGNEADTSTVIKRAYVDGKRVVFPVTDRDTGIITPVYAEKDAIFSKGAFSVREPDGGVVAQLCDIDIILVPGIVFDRAGHRIGFGKGCYDKLLTDFKGIKIGFCYSEQMCDVVPEDEFDVCMDYIITQDGIIKCN